MEDVLPSAGDPSEGVGRPPPAAYKETKARRPWAGVGGVRSTVRVRGTTQPRTREGTLLCSCNRRAEDQGIAMLLTTPATIRTLQRKLYAKAKQETASVAHSTIECAGATSSAAPVKQRMGKCACLGVKSIGKPCAGKLHARFDEGGQARACPLLYPTLLHDASVTPTLRCRFRG